MRTPVTAGILLAVLHVAPVGVAAQSSRDRVIAALQARLDSKLPGQLSADRVTLTGDTLRLTGRALVRFEDTSVRAEEIVIDRASNRVQVVGNARIFLGQGLEPATRPRIDFK